MQKIPMMVSIAATGRSKIWSLSAGDSIFRFAERQKSDMTAAGAGRAKARHVTAVVIVCSALLGVFSSSLFQYFRKICCRVWRAIWLCNLRGYMCQ